MISEFSKGNSKYLILKNHSIITAITYKVINDFVIASKLSYAVILFGLMYIK